MDNCQTPTRMPLCIREIPSGIVEHSPATKNNVNFYGLIMCYHMYSTYYTVTI